MLRQGFNSAVHAVLLLQQVQPEVLIVSRITVIGRVFCHTHVIVTRCCHILSIALSPSSSATLASFAALRILYKLPMHPLYFQQQGTYPVQRTEACRILLEQID